MSFEKFKLAYAGKLKFINPNILSVLALLVSFEVGYYFLEVGQAQFLFKWIAALILLRIVIDWTTKAIIVARGEENKKSYIIYNRLCERYSDLFIIGGFMLTRFTNIFLGYFGFISAILVSFAGLSAKAEGVDYAKQGPMCNYGRMILILLAVLAEYYGYTHGEPFVIFDLEHGRVFSWLDLGATLLIILSQITIFVRLLAARKQIMNDETKQW